jgi:hypothetical protein
MMSIAYMLAIPDFNSLMGFLLGSGEYINSDWVNNHPNSDIVMMI